MQFELLELMTLCFAWVVYHQPILAKFFCLSGVFGGIGAELRGHVYKQRYIKDIRLFGEKAKAFNFFGFKSTHTYAAPAFLGSCILFLSKCVY